MIKIIYLPAKQAKADLHRNSINAITSNMELSYPGYKKYFDKFRTKPFHSEYTTRYCNSREPLLQSQVPKYSWCEPRRPTAAKGYELGEGTKLTYLRPPFAARMTNYVSEENYKYLEQKTPPVETEMVDHGKSYLDRGKSIVVKACSPKLPDVANSTKLTTRPAEIGSPKEKFTADQMLQKLGISVTQTIRNVPISENKLELKNPSSSCGRERNQTNRAFAWQSTSQSRIANSFSDTRARKLTKVLQTPASTRGLKDMTSHPGNKEEEVLRKVAPRPSTLLSKHPKNVRYVRDTCFFHPTQERKKHYYIVNPNWFSEQRVRIPKNNVFS